MKYDIQDIKKAREIRLSGKSLTEISIETNIPRSTLSNWLRDITLSNEQMLSMKKRVLPRTSRGRLNSSISLRANRMFKERKVFDEAEKDFVPLSKESFFIHGLTLYLMGGTKKGTSFQFSDSDKLIIKIMIKWVKRYLKVERDIIKVRNYGKYERIYICRVNILRKVIAWQKLLIKYYNDIVEI